MSILLKALMCLVIFVISFLGRTSHTLYSHVKIYNSVKYYGCSFKDVGILFTLHSSSVRSSGILGLTHFVEETFQLLTNNLFVRQFVHIVGIHYKITFCVTLIIKMSTIFEEWISYAASYKFLFPSIRFARRNLIFSYAIFHLHVNLYFIISDTFATANTHLIFRVF